MNSISQWSNQIRCEKIKSGTIIINLYLSSFSIFYARKKYHSLQKRGNKKKIRRESNIKQNIKFHKASILFCGYARWSTMSCQNTIYGRQSWFTHFTHIAYYLQNWDKYVAWLFLRFFAINVSRICCFHIWKPEQILFAE